MLSIKQKTDLSHALVEKFNIEPSDARIFIEELQSALQGEVDPLFYHILYVINEAHDVHFAMDVFHFVFREYLKLKEQFPSSDVQKKLDDLFEHFFRQTFGVKCQEYLRSDERDEAAIMVLQHMSERMNNVLTVQQEMIVNLSHAMRTSLNGIIGYTTALKSEPPQLSEKQQYYLHKSHEESIELQLLVQKILDISKINSGQMELSHKPFWLEEVLSQSIEKVLPGIHKKQLQFKTYYDLATEQYIGDTQYLTLILTHLLQNAVKFTSYGKIDLSIKSQRIDEAYDDLTFSLTDTGMGFSPVKLKQVRHPFVCFSAINDKMGSGLYIVSKLIRKMYGHLDIQSTEGEGTTVTFTLRLQRSKKPQVDLSSEHFLFFNDEEIIDAIMFKQLKEFLQQHGAQVDVIKDESHLMSKFMDLDTPAPSCFILSTKEENYERYNALVHYLKSMPRFAKTKFFAQHVFDHSMVNFFDNAFSSYIPLSTYMALSSHDRIDADESTNSYKDQSLRILAVDDIATNLEVLQLFIKLLFPKAELDLAAGGYEAIGMYKMVDYDLVLLDLKMPGLNGYDVIAQLRDIKPLPPTFALTADVYKKTFEKISKEGFDGLLEKPIQPDVMEKTIKKVLHEKTH